MNIRILDSANVHEACALAHYVYDMAVRNSNGAESINSYFDEYVIERDILEKLCTGELIMWGAYEKKQLAGVCAMTKQGHITMLYIHPNFLRRKIAAKLLMKARIYAGTKCSLENVSVNAIPAYTCGYFKRNGFTELDEIRPEALYIPMQAKSVHQVEYEKRSIPRGALYGVFIGFFALIALIGGIYSVVCAVTP